MAPSSSSLARLLKDHRTPLENDQVELLWRYHQMLRSANATLNLTRIHNFEAMVLKHYVDSLLVLNLHEPDSPMLDMGTGAGLPGIPIKIARPKLEVILAEPRAARAEFLEEVCKELGLEGVTVVANKIGRSTQPSANSVITRAVATIGEILDRAGGCVPEGGKLIFMKGPHCDAEVEQAKRDFEGRFALAEDHPYRIPGTEHERRLLVYKKLKESLSEVTVSMIDSPDSDSSRGPDRIIESDSNPLVVLLREIQKGKGVRKRGVSLFSGQKVASEIVANFLDLVEAWITGPEGDRPDREGVPWFRLSKRLFDEFDVFGTHGPLLQVRVPEIQTWVDADPWPTGCTLFVPFQDPENVGAVVRSAAAFGVARVVLCKEAAHPFHPRALRAAGPAVLQVPLLSGPSVHELRSLHVPLIALATDGERIDESQWPGIFGLVVGLEGPGLPEHLRSGPCRRIPIVAGVESLNAATAAAIALYDWSRGTRLQ